MLIFLSCSELYGYASLSIGFSPNQINTLFTGSVNDLYSNLGNMQTDHANHESGLTDSYNSLFTNVIQGNLCDYSQLYTNISMYNTSCSNLGNGIATKGLYELLIDYLETMRETYNSYATNSSKVRFRQKTLNSETFKLFGKALKC